MSTIVQIPVRVKPPPALTGEIILAGLRVLRDRDAGERGADHGVVERRAPDVDLAVGHHHLLALHRDARGQGIDLGARRVELGPADDALVDQHAGAPLVEVRFREAHLQLVESAARRLELRLRQRQPGPLRRIVEQGQHLALGHRHALLDEHLDDLPRHLGRDGGLQPGVT